MILAQAMSPSADVLYCAHQDSDTIVAFKVPPALQPQHAAACAVARQLRMRPLANALRDGRSPATASWNL